MREWVELREQASQQDKEQIAIVVGVGQQQIRKLGVSVDGVSWWVGWLVGWLVASFDSIRLLRGWLGRAKL